MEQRETSRVPLGMIWLNAILAAGIIVPPAPLTLPGVRAAREAVEAATRTYGPGHPATAMMVRNLALAFEQAGYANYAEYYARQAIAALEAKFGTQDSSLVPALNVLTEAEASQGRYVDAERTARRAVAIGPLAEAHYATALHNLGAVLEAQGKLCEAAAVYSRALAARQAALPSGHPYIAITRASLERVAK
jgi:tetratricopeptide (TPR) repeat protein